jgi:tRNA (guanosine-2'-O-)-methyltransferase
MMMIAMEDFDISKPVPYFLGRNGLSEEILQRAGFLKIPMVGFTESLNICVWPSLFRT